MELYTDTQECITNVILDIGLKVLLRESAVGMISGFQAEHQTVLKVSKSYKINNFI